MIRTHGITHSSSGGSGFGGPGIDPGFGGLKDDGAIPKDDVLLALQEQLQRCTTVNELYHLLASHILCLYKKGQVGRLLIGLVGCPGAGKTTMSKQICNRINEISRCDVCMVLPMDGFHLTKKQLDAFPDPKEAHRRRGSPWTFDGDAFARALYEAKNGNIVRCPSFDHAQGDPVPESILISPACRIVLVEGLYLLLQQEPWTSAARNLHECWFLETELEVALERVKHRQAIDHPDRSTEEITTRVEENDKLNALLVLDTKDKADLLVPDVMHS